MALDDLRREVEKGWTGVPAVPQALAIINFMEHLNNQELRMLTIPRLLEAVGRDRIDADFLAALAILVSSSVHALDAKAFLHEQDGPDVPVSAQELATARQTGSLEHPVTGDLIENFEDRLIPYFAPSQRFWDVRAHG